MDPSAVRSKGIGRTRAQDLATTPREFLLHGVRWYGTVPHDRNGRWRSSLGSHPAPDGRRGVLRAVSILKEFGREVRPCEAPRIDMAQEEADGRAAALNNEESLELFKSLLNFRWKLGSTAPICEAVGSTKEKTEPG